MLTSNETYVIIYIHSSQMVHTVFSDKDQMLLWLTNYMLEHQDDENNITAVIKGQLQHMNLPGRQPDEY